VTSGSSSSTSDSLDWIQRFIRGFGSPNNCFSTEICNWHKDHAHAFTFRCGLPTADYRNSELILLWGHNPANVWLAQAEAISAARARGARLAVIDPLRTGSARDADLWLRIRPGTDAALALGLARWLIVNRAYDADFVRHWTDAAFLIRNSDGGFLRAGGRGRRGPAGAWRASLRDLQGTLPLVRAARARWPDVAPSPFRPLWAYDNVVAAGTACQHSRGGGKCGHCDSERLPRRIMRELPCAGKGWRGSPPRRLPGVG